MTQHGQITISIVLTTLLTIPILTFGQTSQQKLQEANAFLDDKDYVNSLKLFREIYAQVNHKDTTFNSVAYGLCASLFYTIIDKKAKDDWNATADLSVEFIKVLRDDKDFIPKGLQEKKYWAYKDLVVAYFGLEQRDKAKPYQKKLYDAFKKKQLPEGIEHCYNFEKIVHNNQNVWGYEWFAELGDKEAEGSFSKQVYYIYSQDSLGRDKDQLFTLETVKIHKLKKDEPDFVLTKRVYDKKKEQSETIWTYTFDSPIDYEKLHNAIVEYLKGRVKTDTRSINKHD